MFFMEAVVFKSIVSWWLNFTLKLILHLFRKRMLHLCIATVAALWEIKCNSFCKPTHYYWDWNQVKIGEIVGEFNQGGKGQFWLS